MLPVIRAKESARNQHFPQRHRSVDPRMGKMNNMSTTAKRLNVFQPKTNSFGIGASEIRYEGDLNSGVLGGTMLKDPSIKFQKIVGSPE